MSRTMLALSALALTCFAISAAIIAAQAEEQKTALVKCPEAGDFRAIADELGNLDHQEMRGRGLSETGNAMVLFADGDMAKWSAVVVRPDGKACVADHGKNFELLGEPGQAT